MSRAAITDHAIDLPRLQAFANRRREVTGIQTNGCGVKVKAFFLAIQATQVRHTVMDIARGDMHIGDNITPTIHRTVIQIKKNL